MLKQQMLRRRPVSDAPVAQGASENLQRSIGTFQLTMFGVGSTVGTGIFFVLSQAVPEAGPSVIVSFIIAGVAAGNAKLSRVEQIKRFRILPTLWEPGGDEITLTMKLKRKPITMKYAQEIEQLYADQPPPEVHEPSEAATVQPA